MSQNASCLADLETIRQILTRPQPAKWLFAGDSITEGALHTFGARDFTEHFSERLRFEMRRKRDCIIKTGVGGWSMHNLLADIEWSLLQYKPDVVSLKFGSNDCITPGVSVQTFRRDYEEVIRRVRQETGAPIIVHTPLVILPGDAARHRELPPYVEAARELAQKTQVVLIDHAAHWKTVVADYLLSDAVHPNDLGHRAMAHLLFKVLGIWDEKASNVCRLFVPVS